MLCFIFVSIFIKINHLHLFSVLLLHTLKAFVWDEYVDMDMDILSNVYHLLPSSLISEILLTSAIYTQCASLINLCYDFSMISVLNKQFI